MRDASRCSALGWVARLESWGTHRAGALALRKPFSPRGVHELVRMLQRQRGGAFASRLRAGGTRGTQGRLRPVPEQGCSAGGCHFDACRAFEHLHPLRAGIPHDSSKRSNMPDGVSILSLHTLLCPDSPRPCAQRARGRIATRPRRARGGWKRANVQEARPWKQSDGRFETTKRTLNQTT